VIELKKKKKKRAKRKIPSPPKKIFERNPDEVDFPSTLLM
jgi:hypothetical protein